MLVQGHRPLTVLAKYVGSMNARSLHSYNQLQEYKPPLWAADLSHTPSAYVQLATHNTPIHPWMLPGLPEGFEVSVKRDDMTGCALSGNKARKLEFLLADALQKHCDSVITCGGIQSNHSRTTAVACRQLGIQPHLFLRYHGEIDTDALDCRGNLLMDRLMGSKIILVPPLSYEGGPEQKGLKHKMNEYKEKLVSEGCVPYLIPVGGSTAIGTWGYIQAFKELIDQSVFESFDDIVVAVGSGGTLCGLAIGNFLTGSKLRVHGVCVCDNADYFHGHIDEELQAFGLTTDREGKPLRSRDIVDVIEGYKGLGYGLSTEEELGSCYPKESNFNPQSLYSQTRTVQLVEIMTQTGISLDPVYTLKGVRGMVSEMNINPKRFLGKRVLYIHTGGLLGLYDGRMDKLLKRIPSTNNVHNHKDVLLS